MTPPQPSSRRQCRPLVRAFLGRFFDNEITDGTNDLLQSFFWLVAFLAMPGILMPVFMSFNWGVIGQFQGLAALRAVSRADKAFYLGMTMIGTASVTAIVWNALLVDRRDALVLGVMPVRPHVIVGSKLAALALYLGIITGAMHGLSALMFGLLLDQARDGTFAFLLRGVAAHAIAGAASSAFVVFFAAAVQGLALVLLGPRVLARAWAGLQLVLVVAIGFSVFLLPYIPTAVSIALEGSGANRLSWVVDTPPMWFLGLYEQVLGTRDVFLIGLGDKALTVTGIAIVVTLATYLPAYRRVMRTAVEVPTMIAGRSNRAARVIAACVARRPSQRAIAAFFLTTLQRVERHRFALAIGVGASFVWALPTIVRLAQSGAVTAIPRIDLLTLPLSMMVFVLVGLRIAAAVPADLKAAWLFDLDPPPAREVRVVLERLLFVLGVAPLIVTFLPWHWQLYGPAVALTHAAFALLVGLLLIQMLLQTVNGVPCTRGWRPERAQLRIWWPVYAAGVLWLADGLPLDFRTGIRMEDAFGRSTGLLIFISTLLVVLILRLRRRGARQATVEAEDPDAALATSGVLKLS